MAATIVTATELTASGRPTPISTTVDGNLQAIAQTPHTINVYIRIDDKPVELYVDDILHGVYKSTQDSGFTCIPVNNLIPNTTHRLRIGQGGPEVWEKTWALPPDNADFDVLVIGANAAGTAAAVTCARKGLRVALMEETNRIGGMASNGIGVTDIRRPGSSNGFFEEFRKSVVAFYGSGDGIRYEPRVANALFKSAVYRETLITLYMKCTASEPIMRGNKVIGAIVTNLLDGRKGRITARVIIDDTDMGDFSAACGARFRIGREARSKAEPHAGEIYFNHATGEILPNSTGRKDRKLQSYAYLMTWKDYGTQKPPDINKPAGYDPSTYRYSPEWTKTWAYNYARIVPGKYEINQHPFGTDWPGINYDYVKVSPERRKEINQLYKDRALGYLYYVRNELGMQNLGLADDEYLDNENFPPTIYAREARRFVGKYLMREDDVRGLRRPAYPDSIGIGDFPMDSHAMEELKDPSSLHKGEGEFYLKSITPPYCIPYGVIVPERIDHLLIPNAVSATHVAHGTLRMEPVQMSLGQAAGIATFLSITTPRKLSRIDPVLIQKQILELGGYLIYYDDVDPNTPGFQAIQFLGVRGLFKGQSFRPGDQITYDETVESVSILASITRHAPDTSALPKLENENKITAQQLIKWITGIVKLSDDNKSTLSSTYTSDSTITRSEAAQIIYDAYNLD